MLFTKKSLKSYKGIDASGPNHVLPPSYEGLSAFMEKLHNNLFAASQAFPDNQPEDLPGDEVLDFVEELANCDKIDKLSLINDFQDYITELQNAAAKKAEEAKKSEEALVAGRTGSDSGDKNVSKDTGDFPQ